MGPQDLDLLPSASGCMTRRLVHKHVQHPVASLPAAQGFVAYIHATLARSSLETTLDQYDRVDRSVLIAPFTECTAIVNQQEQSRISVWSCLHYGGR